MRRYGNDTPSGSEQVREGKTGLELALWRFLPGSCSQGMAPGGLFQGALLQRALPRLAYGFANINHIRFGGCVAGWACTL